MNRHEKYYVLNGSLLIKKNNTREWTFGMKIPHNKIRWQIHKEIRSISWIPLFCCAQEAHRNCTPQKSKPDSFIWLYFIRRTDSIVFHIVNELWNGPNTFGARTPKSFSISPNQTTVISVFDISRLSFWLRILTVYTYTVCQNRHAVLIMIQYKKISSNEALMNWIIF